MGFEVSAERNQCIDWLHRGCRERLASMGMYVYSTYVYTAHADPDEHNDNDFHVYRFADTHPAAGKRVQKLRVNEMFKVPRLFGFTMPREDAEPEKNALFKSVLFKPVVAESSDQVEAFRTLVDQAGSFQGPWQQWFRLQRIMADRFYKLQSAAGKLFTIADIDVSALEMQDSWSNARVRPSAAEFVAKIVVEVVTNMDMATEAKSRPRQQSRPDAKEYERDEIGAVIQREAEGLQPEPGMPAGPGRQVDPDEIQEEEMLKQTMAPHPVPDGDLLQVAFAREYNATSATIDVKKEFDSTFGLAQCPRQLSSGQETRQDYEGKQVGPELFNKLREQQDALFDYRKQGAASVEDAEPSPVINRTVTEDEDRPSATFVSEADSRPGGYALQLIEKAAQREDNPVRLSQDQKDFVAVVAAKIEDILAFKARSPESVAPGDKVPKAVMLLHGQGGSGKTEVVLIVRQLLAHFQVGEMAVAATNSAARVIEGETVHSALVLPRSSSLNLRALDKNVSGTLKDRWSDVEALIVEEVSMVSPQMLGALSYRTCWARRDSLGARPDLYTNLDMLLAASLW